MAHGGGVRAHDRDDAYRDESMTIDPEEMDETASLLANILSTRLINAVIVDTESARLRFKDLARRMNVTPPAVTNMLKSVNLKLSTAMKLSLAMGKELRLLYGDELIDTEFGTTTFDYLDAENRLADRSDGSSVVGESPLEMAVETGDGKSQHEDGRVLSFTLSVNGSACERTLELFSARTDGLADNGDEPVPSEPDADSRLHADAHIAPTSREFSWRHSEKVTS